MAAYLIAASSLWTSQKKLLFYWLWTSADLKKLVFIFLILGRSKNGNFADSKHLKKSNNFAE